MTVELLNWNEQVTRGERESLENLASDGQLGAYRDGRLDSRWTSFLIDPELRHWGCRAGPFW